MKGRILLWCLLLVLACAIPAAILLIVASSGRRAVAGYWFFLLDFITPALLLGLTLRIHFMHKARAA
jgi:hypothetical protein